MDEKKMEKIKRKKKVNVGKEEEYKKLELVKDGKIVGLGRDIMEEIEKKWGVEVEKIEMKFKGIMKGMIEGKLDLVEKQVGINKEREKRYEYKMKIEERKEYEIKKDGNDEIKKVEEMKGKVVQKKIEYEVDKVEKKIEKRIEERRGEGFEEIKILKKLKD